MHFIGSSQSEYIVVSPKKEVPLKVFELHRNGDELVRCYTNLPHKSPSSDGFTKVEIREDVGDQASALCHRNGDGGPMCDFEVTVNEDGYVEWPRANEEDPSKTTISLAAVRPNSLGIIVDRCLRPLRAAMATSPHLSRWNANLSFSVQRCAVRWATATINSGRQCPSMVLCTLSCTIHRAMLHAEIASGTHIELSFDVTKTRSMGASGDWEFGYGYYFEFAMKSSIHVGWVAEAGSNWTVSD